VFVVESPIAYYRAAGALEAFTADPPATTVYNRTSALNRSSRSSHRSEHELHGGVYAEPERQRPDERRDPREHGVPHLRPAHARVARGVTRADDGGDDDPLNETGIPNATAICAIANDGMSAEIDRRGPIEA